MELFDCSLLGKEVEDGLCYDIQMILGRYINPSALPDIEIDREKAQDICKNCPYNQLPSMTAK